MQTIEYQEENNSSPKNELQSLFKYKNCPKTTKTIKAIKRIKEIIKAATKKNKRGTKKKQKKEFKIGKEKMLFKEGSKKHPKNNTRNTIANTSDVKKLAGKEKKI